MLFKDLNYVIIDSIQLLNDKLGAKLKLKESMFEQGNKGYIELFIKDDNIGSILRVRKDFMITEEEMKHKNEIININKNSCYRSLVSYLLIDQNITCLYEKCKSLQLNNGKENIS